eukprot:TRINITY_DN11869_c0_g1_i1.p1 TRINITY_DN11869_c0_g1~~TRINITY_DN11869_c0_g1_i1.p1  ORF type:complete len:518 (-),score=94.69 TRINITY_DN11869_c0_g1_i1:1-1554(-)
MQDRLYNSCLSLPASAEAVAKLGLTFADLQFFPLSTFSGPTPEARLVLFVASERKRQSHFSAILAELHPLLPQNFRNSHVPRCAYDSPTARRMRMHPPHPPTSPILVKPTSPLATNANPSPYEVSEESDDEVDGHSEDSDHSLRAWEAPELRREGNLIQPAFVMDLLRQCQRLRRSYLELVEGFLFHHIWQGSTAAHPASGTSFSMLPELSPTSAKKEQLTPRPPAQNRPRRMEIKTNPKPESPQNVPHHQLPHRKPIQDPMSEEKRLEQELLEAEMRVHNAQKQLRLRKRWQHRQHTLRLQRQAEDSRLTQTQQANKINERVQDADMRIERTMRRNIERTRRLRAQNFLEQERHSNLMEDIKKRELELSPCKRSARKQSPSLTRKSFVWKSGVRRPPHEADVQRRDENRIRLLEARLTSDEERVQSFAMQQLKQQRELRLRNALRRSKFDASLATVKENVNTNLEMEAKRREDDERRWLEQQRWNEDMKKAARLAHELEQQRVEENRKKIERLGKV